MRYANNVEHSLPWLREVWFAVCQVGARENRNPWSETRPRWSVWLYSPEPNNLEIDRLTFFQYLWLAKMTKKAHRESQACYFTMRLSSYMVSRDIVRARFNRWLTDVEIQTSFEQTRRTRTFLILLRILICLPFMVSIRKLRTQYDRRRADCWSQIRSLSDDFW